ncbi:Fragile histidine triad isoform 1 [Theobroma cacao]|uniref:Fragile histidine triad isoform 1 n=1 Tax=Theobroma cacao TaxID=3641 RepID=A0A061GZ92_THECC|nr:Fragile histidine triad isoform 1 [Theobroma cacao]
MTKLQLLSSLGLGRNCFIRISWGGFRTISSSTAALTAKMSTECYTFGPYKIDPKEVFYSSPLSYAMVNLRPVVPVIFFLIIRCKLSCSYGNDVNLRLQLGGEECRWLAHAQTCMREVKRFVDLTVDETSDLWQTAQRVGGGLECHHKASSLTFTIQDGPQSGQTVPHVHIHILPRREGDFERNDEIYDAIDVKEKEMQETLDLDKERKDRSPEEMSREADEYRSLFL